METKTETTDSSFELSLSTRVSAALVLHTSLQDFERLKQLLKRWPIKIVYQAIALPPEKLMIQRIKEETAR